MDKGQAALEGDSFGVLCSAWLHPHRICQHHGLTTSHHKGDSGTCETRVTAITMLIGDIFWQQSKCQDSRDSPTKVLIHKGLRSWAPFLLSSRSGSELTVVLCQKEEECDTEKEWWHVFHPESLPGAGPSCVGLGGFLMLRTPSLCQIFYPQGFVGLFLWHVTKGVSNCLPTQTNKCLLLFFKTKCVSSPWLFLQDLKPVAIISSGALLVSQSLCQVVLQLEWRRKGVCPLGDTHRECLSEPGLTSVPFDE